MKSLNIIIRCFCAVACIVSALLDPSQGLKLPCLVGLLTLFKQFILCISNLVVEARNYLIQNWILYKHFRFHPKNHSNLPVVS